MPSRFAALDAAYPSFSGEEPLSRRVDALQDYNFKLLEYLRYILRNLGPENMNTEEVEEWIREVAPPVDEETVVDAARQIIETSTVIADELYASYGAIADLVVDELRTDYKRAANYLYGDTSDINYIHIHDEQINFVTGTVKTSSGTPLTEQLHHGSRYFYWLDSSKTKMTSSEVTAWPVMVYQYDELLKAQFAYVRESGNYVPVLTLGAGDENGRNKGYFHKSADGLDILYTATSGSVIGLKALASGYLDLYGVRRTTSLDFSSFPLGYFQAVMDGNLAVNYGVDFDANGDPVRIYDSTHSMDVTWW